jgi:RNA polymerase sigma-70 factor (ECF subfamily)
MIRISTHDRQARGSPPCGGRFGRGRIRHVARHADKASLEAAPSTLGDVLYSNPSTTPVAEVDWERLVRAVAAGDQLALHALYERSHRVVFTLAVRITRNRETAEELTVDVFHDVWRRSGSYDPANGTVLGWIMNQARSRALDRLRFEHRLKRRDPDARMVQAQEEAADTGDTIESLQEREQLLRAVRSLSRDEREAIETTYFGDLTYAEAAGRLQLPLGTVKTRIRSALHNLRHALAAEGGGP